MSKKITRLLSILLSVIMVVSMFSIVPFTAGAAEATVLYELVYTLEEGGEYLIVNSNDTSGSLYALTYSSSIGRTAVTASQDTPGFIEDGDYANCVWTAAELTTSGRFTLKNGNNYLQITGTGNTRTLGVTTTAPSTSYYWSYSSSNHNLSYNVSGQISYVRYSSGLRTFIGNSSSNSYVYLYKKVSEDRYNINATAGANGSISPSGETVVKAGEDQTFTVTPNSGYSVDTVTVDGKETILDTANTYTFKDVDDNHTIEVTFKEKTTEDRYYYKQVSSLTAGKQYIITNATASASSTSGSGYAVSTTNGSNNRPNATPVTVSYGNFGEGDVAYVSAVNGGTDFDSVLWYATTNNSGFNLSVQANAGGNVLKRSGNTNNVYYLNATTGSNANRYWTYNASNHRLTWYQNNNNYVAYLYTSGNTHDFRMQNNGSGTLYIYEKTLVPEFTVLFKNDDGNTLQNSKYYLGDTPEYTGTEPQKASTTEGVKYVFDGWDKEIVPVTGNTVYTATYKTQYQITWDKNNGTQTQIETEWVDEGETLAYTGAEPEKEGSTGVQYVFTGWTDSQGTLYPVGTDLPTVTGAATYTATYNKQYLITWDKDNGEENVTEWVDETVVPSYSGEEPTKPADDKYSYEFDNWVPTDATEATAPETYTASYTATAKHTHNGIVFAEWTSTTSLPTTAGDYVLTGDVTIGSSWQVPNGTNLCLNGYGIRLTGNGPVIRLNVGYTLHIFDCDTTKEHYITLSNFRGTAVSDTGTETEVTNGTGVIKVNGGYITGGNNGSGGGGIYSGNTSSGANLYIQGVTFVGNKANGASSFGQGSAICAYANGVLSLDGTKFYYNYAQRDGGANANTVCRWGGTTSLKDVDMQYNVGGGMIIPNGTSVSGKTIIRNNIYTTTNTAEFNAQVGTLDGTGLTDGSYIGLRNGGNNTFTTTVATDYVQYFHMDPSITNVIISTNDEGYGIRRELYTITWKDGDGNTLKTEQVPYGETPAYTGDTPTKTGDIRKVYTFNGNWSPEITEVTGNAEYTAQFDEADKQLIHGVSLTLDGNITVNFMIDPSAAGLKPTDVITPKTITATFAWAEDNNQRSDIAATKTFEVNPNNYEEIGDLVPVSCDVCAAEMTCGINVSVELNGEPGNKTYCVRDYGKDVLDSNSNASKKIIADFTKKYGGDEQAGAAKYNKLCDLVKAMLDYGAKAQKVFGVNIGNWANDLSSYDMTFDYTMQNVTDTMFETAIKDGDGNGGRVGDDISAVAGRHGAKWYTTSVYFLQFNKIRHVFTKANDTFNPSDYPFNQKNFYYYVESAEGIPAAELDKLQDFTVGNETFKYSVLDYARVLATSTKNTPAQNDLAKAVYWYNQAANAYFDEPAPVENVVDLSTLTTAYEAQDGDVLTGELKGDYQITIAAGATITLKDVTITCLSEDAEFAGITPLGDATILLEGTNVVKGGFVNYGGGYIYANFPGIFAPAGYTLTIDGEGSLTASKGDDNNGIACGIGGGAGINAGNIEIKGGNITATGGIYAAGIGGGPEKSCGNIVINGGNITATGGIYAAGIGSGCAGSCGNITITDNVTSVTATKGDSAPNSIGAGDGGSCGTVTIGGAEGEITQSPYTYEPN